MLYTLTISIYQNYQIDQHIASFEAKNKKLTEENSKKIEDYEYYTSPEYIEKIAKQNLGLINPGEEVIIIPQKDLEIILETEEKAKKLEEDNKNMPNYIRWWRFFFVENPYK